VISLTGALTAARVVEVPAKTKVFVFSNDTTGGFAVTVKVTGQTGVSIPAGSDAFVYCNGTDVVQIAQFPLPITLGGTGGTTIATAQTALQVDPAGTAVALAIALG
jgi:hypothetical protein